MNILVERTKNNFRFPGQYYIEETGLYYNWWRWYRSELGRYMGNDPLIFNIFYYTYSKNNPLFYIDIDGQQISKGCNFIPPKCVEKKEHQDTPLKYCEDQRKGHTYCWYLQCSEWAAGAQNRVPLCKEERCWK